MIAFTSLAAFAQDNAATVAARVEAARSADEQYKIMVADIDTLTVNNQVLQDKITSMQTQIAQLRDQLNQTASAQQNSSVQDDLKKLADKIQEVDQKRVADKAAISQEMNKSIDDLKTLIQTTAVAPSPAAIDKPKPSVTGPDSGYSYTVQSGDHLSKIVAAYNATFKSKGMKTITQKQVKETNPDVKWDKLRVGQKIIIPDPASMKN